MAALRQFRPSADIQKMNFLQLSYLSFIGQHVSIERMFSLSVYANYITV